MKVKYNHFFQYLQYMLPYEDLQYHIAKEASKVENKDKNRDIDILPCRYQYLKKMIIFIKSSSYFT